MVHQISGAVNPFMAAGVSPQVEHGVELFVANSADVGAGG